MWQFWSLAILAAQAYEKRAKCACLTLPGSHAVKSPPTYSMLPTANAQNTPSALLADGFQVGSTRPDFLLMRAQVLALERAHEVEVPARDHVVSDLGETLDIAVGGVRPQQVAQPDAVGADVTAAAGVTLDQPLRW